MREAAAEVGVAVVVVGVMEAGGVVVSMGVAEVVLSSDASSIETVDT